jgi:ABC-type cobalamin/Fe3+-siderophores transport system ATPase subunit
MDSEGHKSPLVGVVGPCGSGKSTLIRALEMLGYRCRHIAQEHSYVPYMWRRITNPDILIFLQASFETCTARRELRWSEADYLEQINRLAHARQHAHLTIETDELSPQQVLAEAEAFLRQQPPLA